MSAAGGCVAAIAFGALAFLATRAVAQPQAAAVHVGVARGGDGIIPRPAPNQRARVIATTDGEVDDRCSMIRFLMYANEWDIEGIIYSSSMHWLGQTWAGVEWINADIDHYARVYHNLRANAEGYRDRKDRH